ncbi:vitelline membrane outer layer protein 1 homolog [Mytilus edulis]|uniref:vitelline membrane outer layer protein 1 homolog n=1 Tax=Mytilus edulis TaxID=6550 RepID=UPI0039EE656A
MLDFLMDNIFVEFGGLIFQQTVGITDSTNCTSLLADLFLYSLKIEGPHLTDKTELNDIEIICGSRGSDRCGDTASSGQQVWGNWTGEALCPAKTFLTSFSLQVEKYNATKDSTGANYVRFRCRSFKDNLFDFDLSFPPGYGKYGSYGEWSDACPVNSAICGVKTKIQAAQGAGFDDTALNDVRFFCCE